MTQLELELVKSARSESGNNPRRRAEEEERLNREIAKKEEEIHGKEGEIRAMVVRHGEELKVRHYSTVVYLALGRLTGCLICSPTEGFEALRL